MFTQSAYKSPPPQRNKSRDPEPFNFQSSNTDMFANQAFCTPTRASSKGVLTPRINMEAKLRTVRTYIEN
jgi:hypothetical protein